MAVPVNHDSKPRRFRPQIDERQIMKYVNQSSAEFNHIGLWQSARPCAVVDIAAYGRNRSNRAELVQNFRRAYIAGVNDVFGAAQCVQCLGPELPVCIGDDADQNRSSQFSVLSFW